MTVAYQEFLPGVEFHVISDGQTEDFLAEKMREADEVLGSGGTKRDQVRRQVGYKDVGKRVIVAVNAHNATHENYEAAVEDLRNREMKKANVELAATDNPFLTTGLERIRRREGFLRDQISADWEKVVETNAALPKGLQADH